jgi:NAD(P)-dependent dehydrogenase (short-subunit alcohol dehydrogenase family)
MASLRKVAMVVGVGPGLGGAVARRFAREGFALGLMARSEAAVRPVEKDIVTGGGVAHAVLADATDARAIDAGFTKVTEVLGSIDVLVYNAGALQMGRVLDVTPEQFVQCWQANCLGAFLSVQKVLPDMISRGKGTVLLTGATASLRGAAGFSCLAVGKFGLRALAQSLAREVGPLGVHVAHVVVDGQIDTPRMRAMAPDRPKHTLLSPEALAETYWHLHTQAPTAWTLELDVRPAVEKF